MMAEDGEIEHPADVLDEMRERLLTHGARSPFNWVLRLRAYGKRIRSTTSLGYVYWSDDHEKLIYNQLELTMNAFKNFVKVQVDLVRSSLAALFSLHGDEQREDVVPAFELILLKCAVETLTLHQDNQPVALRCSERASSRYLYRSIFIQDGLVSTVTVYNRGYSIVDCNANSKIQPAMNHNLLV